MLLFAQERTQMVRLAMPSRLPWSVRHLALNRFMWIWVDWGVLGSPVGTLGAPWGALVDPSRRQVAAWLGNWPGQWGSDQANLWGSPKSILYCKTCFWPIWNSSPDSADSWILRIPWKWWHHLPFTRAGGQDDVSSRQTHSKYRRHGPRCNMGHNTRRWCSLSASMGLHTQCSMQAHLFPIHEGRDVSPRMTHNAS